MISRIELKKRAKEVAFSNLFVIWKPILIYLAFMFAMNILFSSIESYTFFSFVFSFIISFIIVGFYNYLLKLIRKKEPDIEEILEFKDIFFNAMIVMILINIFVALWTVLLIIPGIIAALSYSMSFYIMADNKDLEPMDVLKKSRDMMQGHKMELFILQLSFIGWFFLGTLTLGIGLIWILPYYLITMTMYYNELKKGN